MDYKRYIDEKLGDIDIVKTEYDTVVAAIAKAVVNDEAGLRQFVPNEVIQGGNGIEIAKAIAEVATEDKKLFNKVMDIEDLWEFDSADVVKVFDELRKI